VTVFSHPVRLLSTLGLCLAVICPGARPVSAQNDLDAFMLQVVGRRDDNWKKLQQYVLDEREQFELRGPGRLPMWGERRDFTWYIRDGFFVRSPLKFNGVTISEDERRKFEADYLARQQRRERRARGDAAGVAPDDTPRDVSDVDGLIRQTRQPQFISSSYFLRFKFEEGKYALVGRETLDNREVMRVEYYPARMFGGTDRRRRAKEPSASDKARDAEFQRLMNKVALVTLWIEPASHQIVKYTFDNVGFDFLPAQWLVHVSDLKATMTMGQPFPDVWLPAGLDVNLAMTLALGQFDVRYSLEYHDYRRPDVTSRVGIKER
jgi:hypothetical protein